MLYTVDEVAKIFNMHQRTVRRYIEKGQLRAERIGGSWRISEEAVAEMFSSPEVKESVDKHISRHSEDMLDLYLKGKHRLQQGGAVMMYVFVFDPQAELWVLQKISQLMTELNRLGKQAKFDFTMAASEQGLYRMTLIAPPAVLRGFIDEIERLRQG